MHFLIHKKYYLLLFLFSSICFSQSYITTQISQKNGLASNQVTTVFIDKQNRTWIGTDAGVQMLVSGNLYDLETKTGQKNLKYSDIKQDDNNNLWFATYGNGLYKYVDNNLININEKNGLISDKINRIFLKDDLVYIGTDKGLSIYNTETNTFFSPKIDHFKKYIDFPVVEFLDINNQVYFITPYDGVFKIINQFKLEPRIVKIRNHSYVSGIYLWYNKVLEGNLNALKIYDVDDFLNNKDAEKELPIHNVNRFVNRGDHLTVISRSIMGDNGGIHFIYPDYTFETFTSLDERFTNSFTKIGVNDKNKKAFLATQNDGLIVLDLNPNKSFYNASHAKIIKIKSYKEKIILVFNDRIEIKNLDNKLLYEFSRKHFDDKTINPDLHIYFLNVETEDNVIYVQTNIGKFKLTKDNKKFVKISESETPIVLYKNKPYCFRTHINEVSDNEFIGNLYTKNPNLLPQILQEGFVFNDKIVVLSKNKGLFLIENNKVTSLVHNEIFKNIAISFIQKTQKNSLLVVTESDGIYELDPTQNFKQLFHLPANNIRGDTLYFVDNYGPYLVVGTEAGVEFFSNENHFILGESYGLPVATYLTGNVIDDELYIGGHGGYYKFNIPEFLQYDNKVIKVDVNTIYNSKNQNIYSTEIAEKKYLPLNKKNETLIIKFIPYTKKDAKGHLARYRVNPDEAWSSFSSENIIHLSNLNKKKYKIEVEFLDVIKQKRQTFHLLDIEVNQTNWLLVLALILSTFLFLLTVYYYRINKKNIHQLSKNVDLDFSLQNSHIQNDLKSENKVEIGSRFLLNSLNSHFIFNAINYFQYLLLQNKTKDALLYNELFAVFYRKLLNNASKSFVSIANEVAFLKSYLEIERKRFDFVIDFKVELDPNLDVNEDFLPPFILHPITEILLNYSFYDVIDKAEICIKISEVDAEKVRIAYFHNGQSIQVIAQQVHNRFYKTMQLMQEAIYLYNKHRSSKIYYYQVENKNVIEFDLYV